MKKKIMSIIAAAAVIASGSPLCANASYTETINSDHTGYTKVGFMCDEKNDIYICDSPYSNDKYKYARESISEMKHSDRIYLKIDDGIDLIEKQNNPSEENEVTNEINALIGDFKTENGNNVKAFINKYNNEFNYYITPYISDDPNEILKLTPNDARSIKELLTKKDIADDMIFSNDVCSPSRGRIDFTHFYFNTRNKTASEQIEENIAIQNQIKKLAEEKKYDITVSGEGGFINITPTTDMPFEEMYDIAKNIKINCEDLVIEQIKEGAVENESFGGVDLLNAVDGDSNCDEQMDMADAVLIMQALANPNKYGLEGTAENHLTKQGQFNADLNGDGLTVGDAQAIQRKLLGLGSDDNHSKPLPTQRIVLNCQSSCALDETLKIDVAMGDMYSYQQEHNGYPTYDTPGHAEYGIYACDSVNYSKIDNENLIINGENSEFKKVYSKEEMKSLDISGKADDYDSYHHETAEIDFSNFKTGDSGNIVVYFQWEYDEENPYNPSSKISGMSKIVGYYVGEKGVAIGADAEDAQNRYQSLFDSVSNDENVIRFGYYDEDYNKPLPSARIAMKCNPFCSLGGQLTIDVAKGDGSFHPQDYDSNRIYEYSIYPSENFNQINDEKLIVNGEKGSYKKEYAGEEMQVFDIDGKYTDYDAYNHETAVIDFKNYEVGSSGCITFSFKAVFTDDAAPPSTSGMMQNMYFYVGEKGISISNLSVENAIEDYEAAYGSTD